MLSRLFALFVLVPLVEILVLAWIGMKTSWLVPVGLVLGTGFAGAWLVRHSGWQTAARIRAELAAGRMPSDALSDGLFVLLAALLLIVPGVLSDVAAILLLIPATRRLVKRYIQLRLARQPAGRFASFQAGPAMRHDEIIDVQVIEPSSLTDR